MSWQRGCIYYSTVPDVPNEYKPVLVVSADLVSEFMRPIVVQVTSRPRIRIFETDIELRAGEGGLSLNSWALCHQIATLHEDMIEVEPLGKPISPRKMVEVNRAIQVALDLQL